MSQAIIQATRRVLKWETVSSKEKIVGLFEPHTQVIQRHKQGKVVVFGRKLWLEEVEGGIVSGYRFVEGGGQDYPYLAEGLKDHKRRFGKPQECRLGTGDCIRPATRQWRKAKGWSG